MQVQKLMSKKVRTLRPTDDIGTAIAILVATGGRHIPVVDGKRLVGVVSEWDILGAWARKGSPAISVSQIMTGNVHTTGPSDTLANVTMRMVEERVGCLPVVEGDELVGVVDVHDIIVATHREHFAKRSAGKTIAKPPKRPAAKKKARGK